MSLSLHNKNQIAMFVGLKNLVFLFFWKGKKKAGPNKEVIVTRSVKNYGGKVYDVTWNVKLRNGKKPAKHITVRANEWNLIPQIKETEKYEVKQDIKSLLND